jgi:MFS transporter, DHA1 family, multidrug resistance protein
MSSGNEVGLKASAYASLALAFASFGDAFLYPFLPVNSNVVGVPVVWVGVLLSINRFIRIFSNVFVVQLFSKYGLRVVMIVAVALAIFSTLGYALATGVALWVLFRIAWGLSFSAMRIGTLGYAIQNEKQGIALGISRGIQETGPAIALLFAPLLLYYFNSVTIFVLLAAFSTPALYFAWKLPLTENRLQAPDKKWTLQWPSTFNLITFVSAVIIDGVVIVVLGVLFLHYSNGLSVIEATTLAAIYLGYRRICLVALSPAGGWIADKFGIERIFNVSLCLVIIGLIVLLTGWIAVGSVIVFTFYSINSAISPGNVARNSNHALNAVAENATWRDLGAALGTLIGGILITSPYLTGTLLIAIFALAFLLMIYQGTARKALKLLYLWK